MSLSQLRLITGRSERLIRKRLAGLQPCATDGRTAWYATRVALELIFRGEAVDLSHERALLAREQAEGQKLRNRVKRGELLEAAEVALAGSMLISAFRSRMLSLRSLAPQLRATASDAAAGELLEAAIRDALSDLAGLEYLPGAAREGPALPESEPDPPPAA